MNLNSNNNINSNSNSIKINGIDLNDFADNFNLSELQKQLLEIMLAEPHLTQQELADYTGYTRTYINQQINKPEFKQALDFFHRKALEFILNGRSKAAIKLIELLNSKDERIRLKASELILGELLKEKSTNVIEPFKIDIHFVEPDGTIKKEKENSQD